MSALLSRTAYQRWHAAAADRLSALSCPFGHLQYLPRRCHALAEPGSYATMHYFGAPLLFCKDQHNNLKGFHNVSPAFSKSLPWAMLCPARMNTDAPDSSLILPGLVHAQVCSHHAAEVAFGEGRTDMFVCPYHNWSYGEACMQGLEGRPASQMPGCHAGPGAGAPLSLPP